MEKENQTQEQLTLIQLKEELLSIKQLLLSCKKGFETIKETGNIRVASVFLEEAFTPQTLEKLKDVE